MFIACGIISNKMRFYQNRINFPTMANCCEMERQSKGRQIVNRIEALFPFPYPGVVRRDCLRVISLSDPPPFKSEGWVKIGQDCHLTQCADALVGKLFQKRSFNSGLAYLWAFPVQACGILEREFHHLPACSCSTASARWGSGLHWLGAPSCGRSTSCRCRSRLAPCWGLCGWEEI